MGNAVLVCRRDLMQPGGGVAEYVCVYVYIYIYTYRLLIN